VRMQQSGLAARDLTVTGQVGTVDRVGQPLVSVIRSVIAKAAPDGDRCEEGATCRKGKVGPKRHRIRFRLTRMRRGRAHFGASTRPS
jgi:hypothetical protein